MNIYRDKKMFKTNLNKEPIIIQYIKQQRTKQSKENLGLIHDLILNI